MDILNELRTYDVFLSFRGTDTRDSFTDHLYKALLNEDITTFLDEQEVETGEELKPELAKAIKSSRASIVVLSPNYASSTWCLDELVMILEQRKSCNHFVLPIFYHVLPTHVRKQEGSFGAALFEHQKRLEKEKDDQKRSHGYRKLELWAEALTQVADLKGKNANGRETLLLDEIIREIRCKINVELRNINPHLIGMDTSIITISSWLKRPSSKANGEVLTIWGMAGIGKTTLAKYIYWLHRHEFESSSFVEDIERKCAQQSNTVLLLLQNHLLVDILKKNMSEEHNVDVRTSKIEKALARKQTLIVLDGVDNPEQVDILIGRKGFHPGSKIIVTTKDRSVTEKCELFHATFPPKHTEHALTGLGETESLRLFCWHAFGGYDLKEGYEKVATRASNYCGGHPLALKTLGSSLINKDVATWADIFEMLQTGGFHTQVRKALQISFDSLQPENCKELFKHIACFFVENDIELTEAILKECGFHTSYGINMLIDRCLLTIEGKRLKMHQLLQEMGRDLVRQESPENPWERSRVWNNEESLNLLKQDKGTTKIQGLVLDMRVLEKQLLSGSSSVIEYESQSDVSMKTGVFPSIHGVPTYPFSPSQTIELRTNALRKMDKLHLLQLNHVKLKGSYKNFPQGLRGLCMHGFALKYIPLDLPMEKLVALDMSYSNLEQLWKKPKLLGSLKYLDLSYSKLVTVGRFAGLPALEKLILTRCESLIHVCESIGGCDRLDVLDMSYCNKLKKLPHCISNLKNVRTLSLEGCLGAREFEKKKKYKNLWKAVCTKPHASSSAITSFTVPKSLKSLISLPHSLVTLSLRNNKLTNESFPKDLSSMSLLKRLYLDKNPIDFMPDCVKSFRRLKVLSFAKCRMLKSVLCPPSTIKHLYASDCPLLEKISLRHDMLAPPLVEYEGSESLTEVEGVIKIQALAHIDSHILHKLGWTNLQNLKDHNVQLWDSYIWSHAKKLPIHTYYEFGILSTCFPGEEVPKWLAHRRNGSSISLSIPSSSSMKKRIEGINICFVHTFSGTGMVSSLRTKVQNITKNRMWIYYGYIFAVREDDEGIVWLSHWMFSNDEIEDGDEIGVTIVEEEEDGGVNVKECGISLVYNDKDLVDNSLNYYKTWKHIIGGDLSAFQLTSGDYFLCHDRFLNPASSFKDLFKHKTTQNLVGYIPKYKDENADKEKKRFKYLF